jgi:hypothetical protein
MSEITKVFIAAFFALFCFPLAAQAILVTPSAIDFELQQGEEGSVEVVVANNGGQDADYALELLSVELGEGSGELSVSPLTAAETRWFDLSTDALVLAPETAEIITLSVNPSDSIAPGLYTFALSITEKASGQKGVSTNSGVLSLIFITIGSPDAKAELLDFSVDEERFDQLPVNFAITVRNAGERIVQPTGSIQIYNVFGTIVRQLPVNVDGKRILAGDDRTLMVQWGSGEGPQSYVQKLYVQVSQFAFGPFSAELTITPWEGADPLTQQISLFAFPWQLFLVLCLVITAIVVLARLRTHS